MLGLKCRTEFAPTERASAEEVARQAALLSGNPLISKLLNGVLNYVLILNPQRQIVFASQNVGRLLPPGQGEALGKRPGEAFGCVQAGRAEGGCGTGALCGECGGAQAALASLGGKEDCKECRLIREVVSGREALDLLVAGTPLELEGTRYSLLALTDISHEKRWRALERIFLHDILNTASGIEAIAATLGEEAPPELRKDLELLHSGLNRVVEEIAAQKDLIAAEKQELPVEFRPVRVQELLESLRNFFETQPTAEGRRLQLLAEATDSASLTTDERLLRRVFGNLLKNALEASRPSETVRFGCADAGRALRFWVHNPGFMPPRVQLQVFKRSFSTKGCDRGLGTYSVKLLTERYLRGEVGFTSTETEGTTFFVLLPKQPAGAATYQTHE